MISNTARILGNRKNVGQKTLYMIGYLFGIVNGGTRFIWGLLMDLIGFKILMFLITILELGLSGTVYFFAGNKIIFILENLLVACCLSGTFTMITPLFSTVFGKELATEIFGITGFFIGVASFVGPLLTKVIIKEDRDYLMVYSIGGGVCLMKLLALFCFKEKEPYNFKNKNQDEIGNINNDNRDEEIVVNKENEEINNNDININVDNKEINNEEEKEGLGIEN